jgi:transcriptional regulator with XRE-family HTH domain
MTGMAARIGSKISRARERLRWTQQQLADALDVDRKTVDNWENDRTYPRNRIGALEEVLGISLTDEGAPSSRESLREQIRRIEDLARELRAQVEEEGHDNGPPLRREA